MKHLETFESFVINEATKANPNDIKIGDMVRYQTTNSQSAYFKNALYGKVTNIFGAGEFNMVALGWSDKSKQAPEFAYIGSQSPFADDLASNPSKSSVTALSTLPWSKFDWEKELDATKLGSNMAGMYAKDLLKNCTIWKP